MPNAQKLKCWSLEARSFIAGPCKETGGSCPKRPKLHKEFWEGTFKSQVREGSHRIRDQLLQLGQSCGTVPIACKICDKNM